MIASIPNIHKGVINPFTAREDDGVCKVTLTFESADQTKSYKNTLSFVKISQNEILAFDRICFFAKFAVNKG